MSDSRKKMEERREIRMAETFCLKNEKKAEFMSEELVRILSRGMAPERILTGEPRGNPYRLPRKRIRKSSFLKWMRSVELNGCFCRLCWTGEQRPE